MQAKTKLSTVALHTALAASIAVFAVGCSKTADDTVGMGNTPAASTMPSAPATTSETVGAKIDDTVVTTGVKTALLKEPEIKSLDIQVETRNGEVMLSGFVDNQMQKDRAVAVAKAVDGVTNVQDSLALKAGDGSTTVGAKMDDGITTTKVKAALLADSSVKGTDINVETQRGVVQLSGFVDSQGQVDRALQLAQGVQGVTKVDNELKVKK